MSLKFFKCSSVFSQALKLSQLRFVKRKIQYSSKSVGVLGVPFYKGQKIHGVDLAPDTLRNHGFIEQLQHLGLDIKDFGNTVFDYHSDENENGNGKLRYPLQVGAACEKVSEAVKTILLEERKCVTLGGDHSLGIGTVHGHSLVHDVCLLWIDAHADINTPITSLSGSMHDMPVAFLIKELEKYQSKTKGFEWLKPCVKKSNVAYIGLRDIDPLEKLILTKENILHFTMRDVDRLGIIEVTKQALKGINPTGKLSLHVSFDIDSIDCMIIPCTGTPVYGGLTIREVLCIAEEICNLEYFRALDIAEVNPALGSQEQVENTLAVSTLVAKAFLGYSRHGSVPVNVHEVPLS